MLEGDILRHHVDQFLRDCVFRQVGERHLKMERQRSSHLLLAADAESHQGVTEFAGVRVLILEALLDPLFGDPTLFLQDLADRLAHALYLRSGCLYQDSSGTQSRDIALRDLGKTPARVTDLSG